MNLTINHIPKNWKPNNKLAFMLWMQNINSNYYYKIK